MLFSVGCGAGFKDWHFAEGGSEEPRKLQGNKALDQRHAQLKNQETAHELLSFLERLPARAGSELEAAAGNRALEILGTLGR